MSDTRYSKEIPGDRRNFDLPARFDETEGYIGISQQNGGAIDRVLLTPMQVAALKAFLAPRRSRKASRRAPTRTTSAGAETP